MAQYLLIYRRPREQPAPSPAQMQQRIPKWQAWFQELSANGHLQERGSPLEDAGKLVRGARKNVTDGPYVEKDLVMGYSIVEAHSLEHACELASNCPALDNEMLVEVRPVIQLSP